MKGLGDDVTYKPESECYGVTEGYPCPYNKEANQEQMLAKVIVEEDIGSEKSMHEKCCFNCTRFGKAIETSIDSDGSSEDESAEESKDAP